MDDVVAIWGGEAVEEVMAYTEGAVAEREVIFLEFPSVLSCYIRLQNQQILNILTCRSETL